ncbi:MAG: transcriptional repressor [Bdellovibrionaceae bacterium]|nr:transcriptional repressor [Pseudobdellovibrionaceae bacterium]
MDLTIHLARGAQNPPEKLMKREHWSHGDFKRIVREMGLKVTCQRLAILESLSVGRAHVTAQEVYESLFKQNPEIGFATVYRFLKKLKNSGFVTEVRMGGMPARYELTPRKHHDHLTCSICGKIVEFADETIEALQLEIAKKHKFQLTGHLMELYGHCETCR